ncbi:MAG: YidC/Oxa1 family insertase periplasmic-domain containing protein [Bacteroidales bacterium]|nr:YidC/Oxa1 family insertase periplasmic-domain containing protein [Bacteroidales bacterium]
MDKKSIIGLVLIFLIFLGYMFWIKPSDEQIAEMRRQDSIRRVELWRADSLAVAEAQQKALEDSLLNASQLSADALAGGDSTMLAQWRKGLHLFESNWAQPRLNVGVENEVMQLDLTSMGASVQQVLLKKYKTFDNQPLVLINPSADNFDLACIDAQSNVINTKRIPFALFANGQPVTTDTMMHVEEQDSLTLSFRAYVRAADTVTIDADQYLEFRYIVRGDSYEVDFDINFHHISSYINTVPNMSLTWQNRMNRQEQYDRSMKGRNANRNKDSERFYTTLCYKSPEDRPDNLKDGRDDEKQLTTPLEWVAFKQQFFCAILMTDGSFRNAQQLQVTTDRSV